MITATAVATVVVLFSLCMSTLAHAGAIEHGWWPHGGGDGPDTVATIHAIEMLIFVLPVNCLGLHVARQLRHRSLATFRQW